MAGMSRAPQLDAGAAATHNSSRLLEDRDEFWCPFVTASSVNRTTTPSGLSVRPPAARTRFLPPKPCGRSVNPVDEDRGTTLSATSHDVVIVLSPSLANRVVRRESGSKMHAAHSEISSAGVGRSRSAARSSPILPLGASPSTLIAHLFCATPVLPCSLALGPNLNHKEAVRMKPRPSRC